MNGIIIINKEQGLTSRDVVNKLIKILNTKKIGHTGTLDPIAKGVLVVTVGRATKLCELLTSEYKEYIATMKLGIETDTLDITGNTVNISGTTTISGDVTIGGTLTIPITCTGITSSTFDDAICEVLTRDAITTLLYDLNTLIADKAGNIISAEISSVPTSFIAITIITELS